MTGACTTQPNPNCIIPIANNAYLAVDRSGSYTFGYERTGLGTGGAESDGLTANVQPWDHDGDDAATDELAAGRRTPGPCSGRLVPADETVTMQPADNNKQILSGRCK